MAHGVSQALVEGGVGAVGGGKMITSKQQPLHQQQPNLRKSVGVMGSRRIFAPAFKLKVLDSYRNDIDCRGNQRATARKYGIHRRQIQKWLQCEDNLRSCCAENNTSNNNLQQQQKELLQSDMQQQQQHPSSNNGAPAAAAASPALNLSLARLHGDEQQPPPPPPPHQSAQTLAAQQQQQQQPATTASYRFHAASNSNASSSTSSSPSSTSSSSSIPGYPDLMDKIPMHQPYHPTHDTSYSMLDLYHQQQQQPHPAASGYHHHHNHHQRHLIASSTPADIPKQQQQQQQSTAFGIKLESPSSSSSCLASPLSSFSSSSSSSLHSEDEEHHHHHHHQQQQQQPGLQDRRSSLNVGSSNDIKTERASPDSLSTPLDSVASTPTTTTTTTTSIGGALTAFVPYSRDHRMIILEEDDYPRLRVPSNSSSNSSSIGSPLPSSISQQDQLECLPPSPRDSERSSCASSDSEMDQQTGTNVSADLARRRSFSLRFKLDVLDAFHRDAKVAGNQRATARKFGINRRQVQKWLGQESELRGVIELCASRQRLGGGGGGIGSMGQDVTSSLMDDVTPVDLTTISTAYVDSSSSLTPPYSAPGCSLSCCQDQPVRTYYCYSPGEVDSSSCNTTAAITTGMKRTMSTQSCCYPCLPPAAKKPCLEEIKEEIPIQDMPLCLVKPKSDDSLLQQHQVEPVSSTVPSPPAAPTPSTKKDAILFKPYLDNPVVGKPSCPGVDDVATTCTGQLNNNCQETCNLNDRITSKQQPDLALELSFELPSHTWRNQQQQQQPSIQGSHYLDFHQARSAFVRYPATVHYSS